MDQEIKINYADNQELKVYLTFPQKIVNAPGLIVIHEIWGLNNQIKRVCDRLSQEGFIALAPELLSGTEFINKINPKLFKDLQNPDKEYQTQALLRDLMQPLASEKFAYEVLAKLSTSFDFLFNNLPTNQKIGVIGFCFGGTYAFHLAVNEPRLKACVPFYGQSPKPLKSIKKINSPILAFYGQEDVGLITSLPELKASMKKYAKNFKSQIYPKTGHAFFNETNHQAYNQVAAEDSWQKMLKFLKKQLK